MVLFIYDIVHEDEKDHLLNTLFNQKLEEIARKKEQSQQQNTLLVDEPIGDNSKAVEDDAATVVSSKKVFHATPEPFNSKFMLMYLDGKEEIKQEYFLRYRVIDDKNTKKIKYHYFRPLHKGIVSHSLVLNDIFSSKKVQRCHVFYLGVFDAGTTPFISHSCKAFFKKIKILKDTNKIVSNNNRIFFSGFLNKIFSHNYLKEARPFLIVNSYNLGYEETGCREYHTIHTEGVSAEQRSRINKIMKENKGKKLKITINESNISFTKKEIGEEYCECFFDEKEAKKMCLDNFEKVVNIEPFL